MESTDPILIEKYVKDSFSSLATPGRLWSGNGPYNGKSHLLDMLVSGFLPYDVINKNMIKTFVKYTLRVENLSIQVGSKVFYV